MPMTTRITSQHLQTGQYQGQTVRAVGKIVGIEPDCFKIQLAGEGPVATVLQVGGVGIFGTEAVNKEYYEVIGSLQQNNVITAMQCISLGDSFDMDLYAEMTSLTFQYPEMF